MRQRFVQVLRKVDDGGEGMDAVVRRFWSPARAAERLKSSTDACRVIDLARWRASRAGRAPT